MTLKATIDEKKALLSKLTSREQKTPAVSTAAFKGFTRAFPVAEFANDFSLCVEPLRIALAKFPHMKHTEHALKWRHATAIQVRALSVDDAVVVCGLCALRINEEGAFFVSKESTSYHLPCAYVLATSLSN